jgi:molecular chaperone IbpA
MNTSFYSVGFDHFFDHLDAVHAQFSKTLTTNYPPHNISKLTDEKYLIELAVAGFSKDDIDMHLQDNILTIKGKHQSMGKVLDDGVEKTYLHKGISDREFERKFVLAEHVEVTDASLRDGMLKIHVERIIPEHKKPKKIAINHEAEFLAEGYKFSSR